MNINFLKKLSIKWQLIIICFTLITVPIVILNLIITKSVAEETDKQIETLLNQESMLVKQNVKNIYSNVQTKVNSDLKVAHDVFYKMGTPSIEASSTMKITVVNQITKEAETITIPKMKAGNAYVAFNYGAVDKVQEMIGGTATIFQMIPQGALRISTNVLKLDGERAVGTYIPTDSNVYKTVMEGKTYYGRAFVVNAWYLTAYEPIKDINGKIIGVLYVGVNENEFQETLLDSIATVKVGETGYIWIVDSEGNYVLSKDRLRDGENIWEAKDANGVFFIQEMVNKAKSLKAGESYVHYYPWKNQDEKEARMKLASVTYVPEWDWIIGPSAYQEDFLKGLILVKKDILGISMIAILAVTIIAYLFALFITRPVKVLEILSNNAANGDLSQSINEEKTKGSGEIGSLGMSFRTMIQNLKMLIKNIKKNVSSTAVSAENLSNSSEEINAAMQQISSTVQQIAAGAQNVSRVIMDSRKASNKTEEEAQKGSDAAKLVNEKMNKISATIKDGSEKIKALGSKSNEIGSIVETINNITKQTNLLALNASIEAARAGEAGRGFAVVADEVRKLAEESEKATGQISELTTTIQTEIQSSVENMEKSTTEVDEGVSSVQKALKSFGVIPELIGKINKTLIEVSAVTEQNAAGSGEVSSAVQQVSSSMQQVSATAQQLSQEAKYLQKLVSSFKINEMEEKEAIIDNKKEEKKSDSEPEEIIK